MSKKSKILNKSLKLFLASAMVLTSISTLPMNTLANEGITNPSVDAVDVYVSDWATFKSELQNTTTTDIYLQADLKMEGADFSIAIDEKNIHGEGYSLDMNTRNIRVTKANAKTSINNITIKNSGTNGFLWSTIAGTHTINNATGEGNRAFARLEAGSIVFQGTNNITQLSGNNNYNVWAKNIAIESGAVVNIDGGGYARDRGALHTTRGSVLTVAEGAQLNVSSTVGQAIRLDEVNFTNNGTVKATSARDAIATYNTSTTTLNSGSTLDVKSTATDVQGAMFYNSSLFVKSGATLIAVSQGSSSTLTTGKELVIEDGANFSITNTRNGALGSEANATTMVINSTIGVSTWERGKTTLEEPTFSYQGPLEAKFTLSGYAGPKQTNLVTNNADITKNFDTSKVGRIEGGYFVKDPKQVEAEDKARIAVNNLFTSQNPANDAKAGLTQAEIDAAQLLVDEVTDPKTKAALQADIDKAQQQVDALIAAEKAAIEKAAQDKARAAVNDLFTGKNPVGDAKTGLTQAEIDAAQALIDQVTDPTVKAALQADLNKAQQQLDATNAAELAAQNKAREAVNNLFANQDPTGATKAGLTQAEIDAAQALIDKVTDPAKKAALQADLNKAQDQLDAANAAELAAQNAAREAVNNLFANQNPTGDTKTGLTQAEIDAAQALIDAVTDPAKKAALQADLNKAQDQLDAANAVELAAQNKAQEAVNNLFANQDPTGDAKTGLTQAEIDAAQALIDKVTDPAKKAELQASLDKAQAQLDADKAAQDKAREAVNNLFANQNPTGDLKTGITQAEIEAAQALIDQVTDPAKKAELQADLDKAQAKLDADKSAEQAAQDKARAAVNALFANQDPTGDAKTGLTQAEIDAAQALVDKVTDPTVKAALQADLNKAQDQLDAVKAAEQAAQDKARAAVNALFAYQNPAGDTKIGLTQAEIDAAQALIDQVTDPAVKAALQADLDKAQAQLNANLVAPNAPTVNSVTAVDTKVTGKGQAGMTVVVKLADGTEKTGVVNANGDFSIVIPAQAADSNIAVTLKNAYSVASEATTVTVVGLPQPVINPMTISDVTVTGTIDVSQFPASKVKLIINGAPKTILTVGADGSFSYYTGNLAAGTTIEVQYVGPNGSYLTDSKYVGTTVVTEESVALVLNEMTASDMYITGTTLADHRVRVSINGVLKATVTADAAGDFSYLSSYLVKGDVVKAEVLLGANVAKTVSITVADAVAIELVVNEMTIADNKITGTATPNAKLRISINGVAKAVVTADATGNYTYATGALVAGTEVKVEMRNSLTGAYDTSKSVVVSGEIPGLLLTLDDLKAPEGLVSGEATAGYTVRISVNGVVKANTVATADGKYSYNVGVLTGGDVVKVDVRVGTQYLLATEKIVKAEFSLNPILDTDRTITGKAPAGKTVRISINGVPKSVTVADAAGNYTYLIGLVATGDVIKIELRNTETGKYEEFVERTVISESEAGQVTINALTNADTMVTGKTISSGKLKVSVDGKAKTVITADAQGNYSYFISGVTVGQVIKVELKENSTYTSFAETTVTEAPAAE
ncbi:toxin Cry1Ac domain D-VI-related protein [Listeria rustica]|uniref:Bacterial Ig domain-containing protein n=1 Tax=Listeria rustica TaxID=2713503 RepID=A0A7W1T6Y1_9LIST|nr:toxin Cry1Ac domain D-VI-related protein [Listeria rustica]MBA3926632.1 hypothetical protein [Listeria rustica]